MTFFKTLDFAHEHIVVFCFFLHFLFVFSSDNSVPTRVRNILIYCIRWFSPLTKANISRSDLSSLAMQSSGVLVVSRHKNELWLHGLQGLQRLLRVKSKSVQVPRLKGCTIKLLS